MRAPDLEAEIRFLATSEGGRHGVACSGYFPNHDFGLESLHGARHTYDCESSVYPGDTVMAKLTLLRPDFQQKRLYLGMQFTVQEGAKIVGHGTITQILNADIARDS